MGIYKFQKEDAVRFADVSGISARVRGNELIFSKCPYCGNSSRDKEKFSVNLDTGQFHCFRATCGANGNMITLSRDFNFSLGAEVDEYYRNPGRFRNISGHEKPKSKPAAIQYLESRGISEEVTGRYNITVQKDDENILVFPFYDETDTLQFVKYRRIDFDKSKGGSKEWCEPGCKTILFGMNHVNPENDTLILCEGQIDSLSVTQAGIENAVSVPTGANGFTWVPHCWDFLHTFGTLIVFGDHEKDHITLLTEMSVRFNGTVKHVREEDYRDCKDANELLQKYGEEAVATAIRNAVPVKHPLIKPLADVKRVDLSTLEKFPTGIRSLDRIIGGFYFGQLIIITGERGEGKSTLASQFATFAVSAGYTVFFYSGELTDFYVRGWFDSQVAGSRYINKRTDLSGHMDYSVDASCIPKIEEWYRDKAFIYDKDTIPGRICSDGTSEEDLTEVFEDAIRKYGCRVLVIDNLMTAMIDDPSMDQYRQQTIFVNKLAELAKTFGVVIFLVAHPRKKQSFGFGNDDVAGSSNVTNLADVVIRYSKAKGKDNGVDIPQDTPLRDLTVYKNRLTGRTDSNGIRLYYEPESKRISEKEGSFDWRLGWEGWETMTEEEQEELPFD